MGDTLNMTLGLGDLPRDARLSFGGAIRKKQLPQGTILFRFVNYSQAARETGSKLPSPYWLPAETYARLLELQEETELSMSELVRGTLAIAFDFTQSISGLMRARLRHPANVLTGAIAEQFLFAKCRSHAKDLSGSLRKIIAPGGLEQIFVSNLEWGDLFQVGVEPLLRKGKSRFLFAERT